MPVLFLGRISDDALEREYAEADVFLFPNLWEGYGIAMKRRFATGWPLLAPPLIPELVRAGRREGWLVPLGEIVPFATAINESAAGRFGESERDGTSE